MRRRTRSEENMPECLRRFDWREWRPPALPDDPIPYTGPAWARKGQAPSKQPARNDAPTEHQARRIATYYRRGTPRRS